MTFNRQDDFDILLSPLGTRRSRPSFALAPRLEAGLTGATIGLLDNSKQNASILLDEIERILTAGGARQVLRFRKASAAMSAGPSLDGIARCDAVVNAFGDCGSCTSWCVHDSVDIEKLGVPVATINTSEFATLGHFEAAALGMPDLPIVAIPHPVGHLGATAVEQLARTAFGAIVTVLTRGADDHSTDYGVGGLAPAPAGEDCGCAI